jgi:hypothetical protein
MPQELIMNFPAYVPQVIRDYINIEISGSTSHQKTSYDFILPRNYIGIDKSIEELQEKLNVLKSNPDVAFYFMNNLSVEADIASTNALINRHQSRKALLLRLTCDLRMKPAYIILHTIFEREEDWVQFFSSAYEADHQYGDDRKAFQYARIINNDIYHHASKLVQLLQQFSDLSSDNEYNAPDIFYASSQIVWQTLSCDHDKLTLKAAKLYSSMMDAEGGTSTYRRLKLEYEALQAEIREFDKRLYPKTIDIIAQLASAAKSYTPRTLGWRHFATISRKSSPKHEYIRAFWYMLGLFGFTKISGLTPRLLNVIAILTTVTIDDPDDVASYEDVRKTLEHSGQITRANLPKIRKIRRPPTA